ncbi:MFS transporter [Nonomuraea sp. NPDC050153]|uniref:MFS transporter n=1 Tax=Nonomuraea sp. NPDC050153 TaxID=3364359 RepID=UPI00379F85B3
MIDRSKAALGASFWRFWAASLASNLSDGMAMIALPWLAATVTDEPFLVGLVVACGRLPWLLLAMPAGVLVDRVSKLSLMTLANAVRCVLWVSLCLVILAEQASVPLLAIFAFLATTMEVVYDISTETTTNALVPGNELERANGHLRTAALVAQEIAGRPLGGFLLRVGTFLPFAFNAIAMILSVAALLMLKKHQMEGAADNTARGPEANARESLRLGLSTVWRHPLLRLILLMSLLINGSFSLALSTQVLFMQDTLGLGSVGFGVIMAISALGGVVGGQMAAYLKAKLPNGRLPPVCLFAMGASYLLLGLFPSVAVTAVVYCFVSAIIVTYSVSLYAIRQRVTASDVLGRVNSVMRSAAWGVTAVGMFAGGLLVDALTPWIGVADALAVPYVVIGASCLATAAAVTRRFAVLARDFDPAGRVQSGD